MIVYSNAPTTNAFPASGWYEAREFARTRDSLEALNVPGSGVMEVDLGLQTANTPDAPDAPVALSSSRTSSGLTFPIAFVDRTSTTGAKQIVRVVYLAKNTGGGDTTLRFCWVAGSAEAAPL